MSASASVLADALAGILVLGIGSGAWYFAYKKATFDNYRSANAALSSLTATLKQSLIEAREVLEDQKKVIKQQDAHIQKQQLVIQDQANQIRELRDNYKKDVEILERTIREKDETILHHRNLISKLEKGHE